MNKLIKDMKDINSTLITKYSSFEQIIKVSKERIDDNLNNLNDYDKVFKYTDLIKWKIKDGINDINIKINKDGQIKYSYNSKIDDNYSLEYNVYDNKYKLTRYQNFLEIVDDNNNINIKNNKAILKLDYQNDIIYYKTFVDCLSSIDMQINFDKGYLYKCIINFQTHKKSNHNINGIYQLRLYQVHNMLYTKLQFNYRKKIGENILTKNFKDTLSYDFIDYFINQAMILINSDAIKRGRSLVSMDSSIVNDIIMLVNDAYNFSNSIKNIELPVLNDKISKTIKTFDNTSIFTTTEKVKKYY